MNGTMNKMMRGTMKEMMNPMMSPAVANTASLASCEAEESALVSENCKVSNFSLAAFASGMLLCVGIIVYALLTA